MICSLNNQSTTNLIAFIEVARRVPGKCRDKFAKIATLIESDQAKVVVEYRIFGGRPIPHYQRMVIDRR